MNPAFLARSVGSFLWRYGKNSVKQRLRPPAEDPPLLVTDRFLRLHSATVSEVRTPRTLADLQRAVSDAASRSLRVSMMGRGHSADGHQFAEGTLHLDVTGFDRVLSVDEERGVAEVEAGLTWDRFVDHLRRTGSAWGIHVKQTLLNDASIGGSVAINIHGRKMGAPPLITWIRALTVVTADGEAVRCSRDERPELFSLVVGGYGGFGIVYAVELQLQRVANLLRDPLTKMPVADVAKVYFERLREGCTYGDAHTCGVGFVEDWAWMTTYRPTDRFDDVLPFRNTRMAKPLYAFAVDLVHRDPRVSFAVWKREMEKAEYFTTDSCQFTSIGEYYDDIHEHLLELRGKDHHVEMQVPPDAWPEVVGKMREIVAGDLHKALVFCDLRYVAADPDSFLAYARRDWFTFSPTFQRHEGNDAAVRRAFDRIYDLVVHDCGGCFYLWDYFLGRPEHLLAAYPQLPEGVALRKQYDPDRRFGSRWLDWVEEVVAEGSED